MDDAYCSSLLHSENVNALEISIFSSVVQIDELMSCIEERLIAIESKSTEQIPDTVGLGISSSPQIQTCIKFGNDLLETALKRVNGRTCKMCYRYKLSAATRTVVIDVLKGGGKTHWLGAGASVLGYILDQVDQISSNKCECIQLLKYMCGLAKRVKQLNENLQEEEEMQMLNDAVHFIVEGSLLCLSQMQSHYLYRFFSATVDARDLRSFQEGLAHKYPDLTLAGVLGLPEKTPTVIPPSQEECPDAVGIDATSDDRIRLLKVDVVDSSTTNGGGEMCECVVDLLYNSLKEPSQKEAILDIVFFFNNWPWRIVSYAVGSDNLIALENAGLVQIEHNLEQNSGDPPKWTDLSKFVKYMDSLAGTVKVVDAVRARGKKLSNSDRIVDDLRSFAQAVSYRQEKKGIWFSDKVNLQVKAEHFASTSSSLRILRFGNEVKVNGLCKENFENLRYLGGKSLTVDVNNVKKLACLVGNVPYEVSQLPSSLRLVDLRGDSRYSSIPAALLESVCNLSLLEELHLHYSSPSPMTLPATFGHLQSLRFVEFGLNLTTLPDSFGNLTALEGLSLKSCPKLLSLPESFGKLESLRFLMLDGCRKLIALPESFGDLFALEELHLRLCSLESLPISFGKLRSLRLLSLDYCRKLIALPESFGNLFALQELRILNLDSIEEIFSLPKDFADSSSLISSLLELELGGTSKLAILPCNFGQLKSLKHLLLGSCNGLESLPANFGQLTSLNSLYIRDPFNLSTLPEGFGSLSSLQNLRLESCPKLVTLPKSFGQLSLLKELYISGPENMSTLPEQFVQLNSLECLSLIHFKSLEKLCHDFQCLVSLATLVLGGCPQLEGKTIDTLVEMKNLMTLNIDGSPMLIERWKQVKDHHTLIVSHKEESRFEIRGSTAAVEYEDDGRLTEIISTALFHDKSSFLHVDVGGKLATGSASSFLSSEAELAILLTKCDLSSSSNREALKFVNNKSTELASQGVRVIYVQVGEVGEKNELLTAQTLLLLSPGTCAWIAPNDKTRQIFAFAVYKLLKIGSHSQWKPWHGAHTIIAGTSVSMPYDGRKRVGKWKIILPQDEAMRDVTGSFSQLFNSVEKSFRKGTI